MTEPMGERGRQGATPLGGTDIKRMDIREFREVGYLQEVNRQFLHPLGLALEIVVEEDGTEHLGGVWDYREDPEGIYFVDSPDLEKSDRVAAERDNRASARQERLGYVVQPANPKARGEQ